MIADAQFPPVRPPAPNPTVLGIETLERANSVLEPVSTQLCSPGHESPRGHWAQPRGSIARLLFCRAIAAQLCLEILEREQVQGCKPLATPAQHSHERVFPGARK